MPVTFLVVPQWQGSGSSRAMRLSDGAEAIRGDLPAASTHVVDVPMEAGDELGSGVPRVGTLQLVRERSLAVLDSLDDWSIAVGGDCGMELAPIEHALARNDGDLVIVWLDAHPDLNTPQSSPSGAFSGMVLRTLLGDGVQSLVPQRPLLPRQLVLAGARSSDDGEDEYVRDSGIRRLSVDELLTPDALLSAIAASGASAVYLHIDLDVLDPGEIAGLSDPVPFGLSAVKLIELIRAVKAEYRVAGAGIAGFSPSSVEDAAEDLPTILRVVGALTAEGGAHP